MFNSRLSGRFGQNQDKLKDIYDGQPVNGYCWHRVYKIACPVCGETIYTQNRLTVYCSYRCQARANTIRQSERKRMNQDKICLVCLTAFKAKRGDAKYCSAACKQKAYRASVTDNASRSDEQSQNSVTDKHIPINADMFSSNTGEGARA